MQAFDCTCLKRIECTCMQVLSCLYFLVQKPAKLQWCDFWLCSGSVLSIYCNCFYFYY